MDPLHVRFSSQSVENICFTNHIQLLHDNPVSSVRPSEASSGRFLCFHPDSGGLLDFRYRLHWAPEAGGTLWPQLGEPGSAWNIAFPLKTSSKNPSIVRIVRKLKDLIHYI